MPNTATPAPSGLSSEGLALWERWHDELNEDDLVPDDRESAILAEASRHLTLAARLEAALSSLEDIHRARLPWQSPRNAACGQYRQGAPHCVDHARLEQTAR